jgi:LuxR family maltose regulon positive regulatory protein
LWKENPAVKENEESLAIASGWLRLGEAGQALEVVAHLRSRPHHSTKTLVRLDLLEALAMDQLGDCEHADELARTAAAQAEPEEYIRLFVDENPTAGALLARACANEPRPSTYLERLLKATTQAPEPPGKPPAGEMALSPREIEILRLVAEGLTNQQIAKRLVVAPGTVKKHLDNIYTKLNASNRAQALVIARAKGIK